jgi:hypothetical protein
MNSRRLFYILIVFVQIFSKDGVFQEVKGQKVAVSICFFTRPLQRAPVLTLVIMRVRTPTVATCGDDISVAL